MKQFFIFLNKLSAFILWLLAGIVIGFLVGYLLYGKVLGIRISLATIFSDTSVIDNIVLSSIRQSIVISSIIGAVVGVIMFAVFEPNDKKVIENNHSLLSTSDELIKLNELKEKGIITQKEFDKQKDKILNG